MLVRNTDDVGDAVVEIDRDAKDPVTASEIEATDEREMVGDSDSELSVDADGDACTEKVRRGENDDKEDAETDCEEVHETDRVTEFDDVGDSVADRTGEEVVLKERTDDEDIEVEKLVRSEKDGDGLKEAEKVPETEWAGVLVEENETMTESVGFGETVAANEEAAGLGELLCERGAVPVCTDCVATTEVESDGVAETRAGFVLDVLKE